MTQYSCKDEKKHLSIKKTCSCIAYEILTLVQCYRYFKNGMCVIILGTFHSIVSQAVVTHQIFACKRKCIFGPLKKCLAMLQMSVIGKRVVKGAISPLFLFERGVWSCTLA